MIDGFELACHNPGDSYWLGVRNKSVRNPEPGELLVRVNMSSVNPIDAKRAAGYGRSLLRLKGAAGKAPVLGNDFVGVVQAVGAGVSGFKVGDRVFGLVPTGRQGAYASHVLVAPSHVRPLPRSVDALNAVTLPYSFNTMYQCLQGLSLSRGTAKGKKVLICGAAGMLGSLATQVLSSWGAEVTAICAAEQEHLCFSLGAKHCMSKSLAFERDLPATFDATLNFAAWDVDEALTRALHPGALGHATTVHPLMSNTDAHGFLAGGVKSLLQWWRARAKVRASASAAKYLWVVFRPNPDALTELSDLLKRKALAPTPTRCFRFPKAQQGFDLSSRGHTHRAVLIPSF